MVPRQPPSLPPHLSHKSAIVLIPPPSLHPPIEQVRRQHDRHVHRWMPHITLIYPFLANPSSQSDEGKTLNPEIKERITRGLQGLHSFPVELSATPAGVFTHSKRSQTVWLRPVDANSSPEASGVTQQADDEAKSARIVAIYDTLKAEFGECFDAADGADDGDEREFTPHLTLGQAGGGAGIGREALMRKAESVFQDYASSNGVAAMEWMVDRVAVVEREGFKGRFHVVGEVILGADDAAVEAGIDSGSSA